MNKKAWSIILLCVICFAFVCETGLIVGCHIKLNEIGLRTGGDISVLAVFTYLHLGTVIIGGLIASVGFFCSLVNIKIAPNTALKNISIVSVCVWSVIFLLPICEVALNLL